MALPLSLGAPRTVRVRKIASRADSKSKPADYPLGALTARIVFKTESNMFGFYDHEMTINPTAAKKR